MSIKSDSKSGRSHLVTGILVAAACVFLGFVMGAMTAKPEKVIVEVEKPSMFSTEDTQSWIQLARLRVEETEPKYRMQRLLALTSQFSGAHAEKSALEELASLRAKHPDLYVHAVKDGTFYRLRRSKSKAAFTGSGFGTMTEAEAAGEELHAARILDDEKRRIDACKKVAARYPNTMVSRIAELDIQLANQILQDEKP